APVITTAPIRCMSRIFIASPSVAVGLIVTTSLPLRDRIALTVMGILPGCGRPLYRKSPELHANLTAPYEPFDNRRPCSNKFAQHAPDRLDLDQGGKALVCIAPSWALDFRFGSKADGRIFE